MTERLGSQSPADKEQPSKLETILAEARASADYKLEAEALARGSYKPLEMYQIKMLRGVLTKSVVGESAWSREQWNALCDMAESSLLYSQEIERLRTRSAGTRTLGLTFDDFRSANVTRCLKWHPAGIESWSPSDWLTAVTGELGELASLLKMRNRERDGLPGNKFSPSDKQVADELADVLTYLDLLAAALGVDLGAAAVEKFNEVSARVGFPDRIERCARSASERITVDDDTLGRIAYWADMKSKPWDSTYEVMLQKWSKLLLPLVRPADSRAHKDQPK